MTCSGKNLKLIGWTSKWADHKSLLPWAPYACFQPADKENFYEFKYFHLSKQVPAYGILSSGYFPDVWILKADVSEHSVGSIFTGGVMEDGTDSVPKRRLLIFRCRGNTQRIIYYIYNAAKAWKLRSTCVCWRLIFLKSI
jgi:hypothetical protein